MKQQPATPETSRELTYPAFGKGNIIFKNCLETWEGICKFPGEYPSLHLRSQSYLSNSFFNRHPTRSSPPIWAKILSGNRDSAVIPAHLKGISNPAGEWHLAGSCPLGRMLCHFGRFLHGVLRDGKAAMLRLMLRGKFVCPKKTGIEIPNPQNAAICSFNFHICKKNAPGIHGKICLNRRLEK